MESDVWRRLEAVAGGEADEIIERIALFRENCEMWFDGCWLLANVELGRAFARYTRRSSSLSENWYLIAVFLAIPILWGVLTWWERYRKNLVREGKTPKALFLELCRAHALDRQQRALLWKASQALQLKQPALVFIDPAILGGMAASASTDAGRYAVLKQKLFGDMLTPQA